MIVIGLGFVILAALSLWIIIGLKGNWILKACVITGVLFFVMVFTTSVSSLLGRPAFKELPDRFMVYQVIVRPPTGGSKGEAYLWIDDGSPKPLSVEVPYTKRFEKQAQRIRAMLMQGKIVIGKKGVPVKGKGKGKKGEGNKLGKGGSHTPGAIEFYELPPAHYPRK